MSRGLGDYDAVSMSMSRGTLQDQVIAAMPAVVVSLRYIAIDGPSRVRNLKSLLRKCILLRAAPESKW